MTAPFDLESVTNLPDGTWIVRLDSEERLSRLHAQNASERGDLAGGTYLSLRCLFAGTLHNRSDLLRELGADPNLDVIATLLRAHSRWGDGLLDRLEGVFALVIWDQDSETLLAARDAMGLYPLFYSRTERTLLLSNSIKALVGRPDVSAAVNLPALVDHLRHAWPYPDETYFESVRRVSPGHALRHDRSGVRVWRYWDPSPDGTIDWVTADELPEFDRLLEQAVVRCQSLGPAAVFLSGGLDSVSVAAVATSAARAGGLPDPLALSLAFPDPDANEEPVQRGVASALGIPQVLLDWSTAVGQEGLIRGALDLTTGAPAPLVNVWTPAYDRLARAGKDQGRDVILTGTGGDEWLTVSPFYAADLLRRGDLRGLGQLYLGHSRSHNLSRARYLRNILWRFGARPIIATTAKRGVDRSGTRLIERSRLKRLQRTAGSWLAPGAALRAQLIQREQDIVRREALRRGAAQASDRSFPSFYVGEMRSALDHPLVAMELEETFEQSRRLGIRILSPYWDADLVSFLYRTPPELLNRGGRSKGLVRDAVAHRFPMLGFERQRKVSAAGFFQALMREESSRAFKAVGEGALAEMGVIDAAAAREHLKRVFQDPQGRGIYLLWDVLTLDGWLGRNRQQGSDT